MFRNREWYFRGRDGSINLYKPVSIKPCPPGVRKLVLLGAPQNTGPPQVASRTCSPTTLLPRPWSPISPLPAIVASDAPPRFGRCGCRNPQMCGQPRLTVRAAPSLVLSRLCLAVFWAAPSERSLALVPQVALVVAALELGQPFEAHLIGQSCY